MRLSKLLHLCAVTLVIGIMSKSAIGMEQMEAPLMRVEASLMRTYSDSLLKSFPEKSSPANAKWKRHVPDFKMPAVRQAVVAAKIDAIFHVHIDDTFPDIFPSKERDYHNGGLTHIMIERIFMGLSKKKFGMNAPDSSFIGWDNLHKLALHAHSFEKTLNQVDGKNLLELLLDSFKISYPDVTHIYL